MGKPTPSLKMLQRLARTLGLRFLVEVAPAREGAPASVVMLPPGVAVVEDVTGSGSRIMMATG